MRLIFPILLLLSLSYGQHFVPAYLEYASNPFSPMDIYVGAAQSDGMDLETGDEIGIFDGDVCVGAGIVEGTISNSNQQNNIFF